MTKASYSGYLVLPPMQAYQPSLSELSRVVTGEFAAYRFIADLCSVGGDGDKIFPPTYSSDRRADKYSKENRVIGGKVSATVLLDSVQSQANRIEAALQELYDSGRLDLPMVQVSFPEDLGSIGRVTVLQAPHRLADAILRDSTIKENGKEVAWRESGPGRRFIQSTTADASGILGLAPTALLLGMWDSTGGTGSAGNKFARALVSEIVGHEAKVGEKPQSRIDPLQIEKSAGPLYEHATEQWTLDPKQAVKDDDGNPKVLESGDGSSKGAPSAVNHGNIVPSIDTEAGGVSVEFARQTSVLSLTRLRMLKFGNDTQASIEARTYLAALGLVCLIAQKSQGYWLRSRCELVPIPEKAGSLELVGADGQVSVLGNLSLDHALELLSDAAAPLRKRKLLPAKGEILQLSPSDKLVTLVRRSRGLNPQQA